MANTVRAKTWWRKAWSSYSEGGSVPTIKHPIVAAGQTIYKGDWVQLNAAGAAIYAAVGAPYVYGLAIEDGVVGSPLAVSVASSDTVFIMQHKDGVASSTAIPGKAADLYISGAGVSRKPQVDSLAPIDNIFLIMGLVPDDDSADTTNPGRVFVKVLKSQYNGT